MSEFVKFGVIYKGQSITGERIERLGNIERVYMFDDSYFVAMFDGAEHRITKDTYIRLSSELLIEATQ